MIFISGKYGGLEENKEIAIGSAKWLYENFNEDAYVSGIWSLPHSYDELPYDDGLSNCIDLLEKCDSIIMLMNFYESEGALKELEYAKMRGKRIYLFDYTLYRLYLFKDDKLILWR